MKRTINPAETPQEHKEVLRAWIYGLLAEIELCQDVFATKETINGESHRLNIEFKYPAINRKEMPVIKNKEEELE